MAYYLFNDDKGKIRFTVSDEEPTNEDGNNGDVWIVYGDSAGGGGVSVYTKTVTLNTADYSITFSGLSKIPKSYICISTSDIPTGSTPIVAAVVYDGTNIMAQTITNTSDAQVSYDDAEIGQEVYEGEFMIYHENDKFQAGTYKLIYTLSGTVSTIDQSVGSGATSITFTGLTKEPAYFSCIFKSNFATSSGYQRVIVVGTDDTGTIGGLAMDSQANAATTWTYTYNNGSLTITSNGTNSGGYFHQPGNYQLTYV